MDDSHRFSRAFTLRRLPRSLMVAALACLLMAAPAAARALIPSTTTAVSIKITTHPATDARTTTAKFAWKATGTKLSVSCRLGSGKYAKCSKTHTYANMKPGAHSFTVRAVSGKTTRTAVYKWTVDTTAPTAPTVSGGSPVWTTPAVTIKASGSTDIGGTGVGSYQYRASVEGGSDWSAVASGSSLTVSTTGTTWVQFRAVDKAGNAIRLGVDRARRSLIDRDDRQGGADGPGRGERCGCMVECRIRGGRADRGVDGRRRLGPRAIPISVPHQPQPRDVDGTPSAAAPRRSRARARPRSSFEVPTSPETPRRGRLRSRCGSTAPPQRSRSPPIPPSPRRAGASRRRQSPGRLTAADRRSPSRFTGSAPAARARHVWHRARPVRHKSAPQEPPWSSSRPRTRPATSRHGRHRPPSSSTSRRRPRRPCRAAR